MCMYVPDGSPVALKILTGDLGARYWGPTAESTNRVPRRIVGVVDVYSRSIRMVHTGVVATVE